MRFRFIFLTLATACMACVSVFCFINAVTGGNFVANAWVGSLAVLASISYSFGARYSACGSRRD